MTVRTIGVPMDLGADRRGVDMGPSAIRYAGLAVTLAAIDHECIDAGDLPVPHAEERDPEHSTATNAKYLRAVEAVCTRLADEVESTLDGGALPLVLGGTPGTFLGARMAAWVSQSVIRRGIVIVLSLTGLKLLGVPPEAVGMIGAALLLLGPLAWGWVRQRAGLPAFDEQRTAWQHEATEPGHSRPS